MAGRTMVRTMSVSPGHQLVAHALGVGVDVGPAPVAARSTPRSVSSWRTQSLRSRASDSFSVALVVGIAPLLFQAVPGALAQHRHHLGVVGLGPHLGGHAVAVGDLLLDGEAGGGQLVRRAGSTRPAPRPPTPRRAVAGDEAGAGVQDRRALHPLDEGDDVLGPLRRWCAAPTPAAGLKVTLPDELMTTSMSWATAWAASSVRPRFGSVMSPSTTRTFSAARRAARRRRRACRAAGRTPARGRRCSRSGPRCWCPSPGGP